MVFLLVADLTLLVVVRLFFLLVPFAFASLPHGLYFLDVTNHHRPLHGQKLGDAAEEDPSRLSTAQEHN